MQDLNKATLTGFVTDPAEVKFKPRKGKSFLVVRSDRFSGTPDDIIVEIPNRLKGTFREWNWIKVSGRIRSKWVRADHQMSLCKHGVMRSNPIERLSSKTICSPGISFVGTMEHRIG